MSLRIETKLRLDRFGRKGESYDRLIARLLDEIEAARGRVADEDPPV